jgi:stress response protein SCP2
MAVQTSFLKAQELFGLEEKNLDGLQLALRWDFFSGQSVDLDASAICFDSFGHLIDAVYYNQLVSSDKAIHHSGDNKDGKGKSDLLQTKEN